jgi:hypothetical protein
LTSCFCVSLVPKTGVAQYEMERRRGHRPVSRRQMAPQKLVCFLECGQRAVERVDRYRDPRWSLDFLVGTVHWGKPLSLLLYTAGGFCLRPVFSLYSGYLAQFLHSSSLAELMSGVSKKIRWLVRTTIVFMHVQYLHH